MPGGEWLFSLRFYPQTHLDGLNNRLGTVGDTKLADDLAYVLFDGADADEEVSGYLLVGLSLHQ